MAARAAIKRKRSRSSGSGGPLTSSSDSGLKSDGSSIFLAGQRDQPDVAYWREFGGHEPMSAAL